MLKFDHLVHFTNNPEEAQSIFRSLGFNAIKGGNHPNWGTHNTLCYFQGLRYIEWIGIKDINVAKVSDNVLIKQIVEDSKSSEGFSQLAFRVDNIEAWVAKFKDKRLEVIGPVDGSRKKVDGTTLSWSMLFIKEEEGDLLRYPFFIQWGQNDTIREQEMQPIIQHTNGSPNLIYLGIIVKSRMDAIRKYSLIFNFNKENITQSEDSFGIYSELNIGEITLRLYEQESTSPLVRNLGERPFLCGISGVSENKLIQVNSGLYHFSE